jgi:hypothetical protein
MDLVGELEQLRWARHRLTAQEYRRVVRFYAGTPLPPGEYLDADTGELIVAPEQAQTVPPGKVYLAVDSLRGIYDL